MQNIKEIGVIKSQFSTPDDPFKMKKEVSELVLKEEYEDGLYKIEDNKYLQVLFYFHGDKNDGNLQGPTYTGEVKGVFASRSQYRPSRIGLTTVKLLERNGCVLKVSGLDAMDGTPILDIKPFALAMDEYEKEKEKKKHDLKHPRSELLQLIRSWNLKEIIKQAAILHGHFCPGLAIGTIAGAFLVKEMSWNPDGMENILVIAETNNCALDGVQFTTGCSIGNNSLIYRDYGKTAFTMTKRDGEGVRLVLRENYQDYFGDNNDFQELFQKVIKERSGTEKDMNEFKRLARETALRILDVDVEKLFKIEQVKFKIPEYAPIHESIICSRCQESTMATRVIPKNGSVLCVSCANNEYYELNGHGIIKK